MTNKYMKECSTSLVTREIPVNTTRYFTPTRMTRIKKITSIGKMEKLKPLYKICGNVK